MRKVRFTRSARTRRIGSAHVIAAMNDAGEPTRIAPDDSALDERLVCIGRDDRGVVLEVIGVEQPDHLLIIHVMPYSYRGIDAHQKEPSLRTRARPGPRPGA